MLSRFGQEALLNGYTLRTFGSEDDGWGPFDRDEHTACIHGVDELDCDECSEPFILVDPSHWEVKPHEAPAPGTSGVSQLRSSLA